VRKKARSDRELPIDTVPSAESADPVRLKPRRLKELDICTVCTTDTLRSEPMVKKPNADTWEPMRIKLRTLNPEEIEANSLTDMCDVIRWKLRMESDELNERVLTRLSRPPPLRPPQNTRRPATMLNPDPTRAKCRRDRLLPTVARSNKDVRLPATRANARIDSDEPSASAS
jgi:hypothetical protein